MENEADGDEAKRDDAGFPARDRAPGLLMAAIADDLTGGVELASMMVSQGVRVGLAIGVEGTLDPHCTAQVVALKTRTVPRAQAETETAAAFRRMKPREPLHTFLKYCATFDSTPDGNIGPAAETLLGEVGDDFTLFCPTFWEVERYVFQGYHFAGPQLLSESPKRFDPLTPMTDSNLLRVLAAQSRGKVGLIPFNVVHAGGDAVAARIRRLKAEGVSLAIADAASGPDIDAIAQGGFGLRLLTGNSGLAASLAAEWHRRGLTGGRPAPAPLPGIEGRAVVLAGSCGERTLEQLTVFEAHRPVLRLDVDAACRGEELLPSALRWAAAHGDGGPIAIATSAGPTEVDRLQSTHGARRVADVAESLLSRIGAALVRTLGVRRILVAGGETSGAILRELGVTSLAVGRFEGPGLSRSVSGDGSLAFVLKSGKLGPKDMFLPALEALRSNAH